MCGNSGCAGMGPISSRPDPSPGSNIQSFTGAGPPRR
jgi:hypothetical protein